MKVQITRSLSLARVQLDNAILVVKAGADWQKTHHLLRKAIQDLEDSKNLIAKYHLKNCLKAVTRENIGEVIKTYKYLN